MQNLRGKGIAVCGGGNNLKEAPRHRHDRQRAAGGNVGYTLVPPNIGPYATDTSWELAPVNLQTLAGGYHHRARQRGYRHSLFPLGHEYTKDPIPPNRTPRAPPSTLGPIWCSASTHTGCRLSKVQGAAHHLRPRQFRLRPGLVAPHAGRLSAAPLLARHDARERWLGTGAHQDRCQPRAMTPAEAVGVSTGCGRAPICWPVANTGWGKYLFPALSSTRLTHSVEYAVAAPR